MTKTLTEQWREGTLPDGLYYVKTPTFNVLEEPVMEKCIRGVLYIYGVVDYNAKEVLAPVPSYEEYRELLDLNVYEKDRKKVMGLEDKVKRLQEQLKEANEIIVDLSEYPPINISTRELSSALNRYNAKKYLEKWGVK